jgi:hypothetical protein
MPRLDGRFATWAMAGLGDDIAIRRLLLGQAVDEDIGEGPEDQPKGGQQGGKQPGGKVQKCHLLSIVQNSGPFVLAQ